MKLENIDLTKTLENARELLEKEENISPALKSVFEILLVIITIFMNRFGLNSNNSSKSPSSDPNRKRGSTKASSDKKPGGQQGHIGKTLKKVENPDEIKFLSIDKRTLPRGHYKDVGYEARQVVDIRINRVVTEYRAQILEDDKGNRYAAAFPKHVTQAIQYGPSFKAHSVYMSQFQLLPYNRIENYFEDQLNVSLSGGSIFNFNKEAYQLLEKFEEIAKRNLIQSEIVHSDETGINVNKLRIWLHSASNAKWTYFFPHKRRGKEATDEIGILPKFKGTLCHDHWHPYYSYDCIHALCNAHHLRELERAVEQDKQHWAAQMKTLLIEINEAVEKAGGMLEKAEAKGYRHQYRKILEEGDKESPSPEGERKKGQRGRIKKSKSRNLLERLIKFEDDVLRFMENALVPFTNNQGENDLRMTKVQQKISGCFRSLEGAYFFCRIRGYLITCRKQGVSATQALDFLFKGELPEFMNNA